VKGPESIADHMYRMGLMSLISGAEGVNTDRQDILSLLFGGMHCTVAWHAKHQGSPFHVSCRCIQLSIVHDVAEGEPLHCPVVLDS